MTTDRSAATCPRVFIPADGGEPCACDREHGHGGQHHCPVCGVAWSLASEDKVHASSEGAPS